MSKVAKSGLKFVKKRVAGHKRSAEVSARRIRFVEFLEYLIHLFQTHFVLRETQSLPIAIAT